MLFVRLVVLVYFVVDLFYNMLHTDSKNYILLKVKLFYNKVQTVRPYKTVRSCTVNLCMLVLSGTIPYIVRYNVYSVLFVT